jgi:hypothetical protein
MGIKINLKYTLGIFLVIKERRFFFFMKVSLLLFNMFIFKFMFIEWKNGNTRSKNWVTKVVTYA